MSKFDPKEGVPYGHCITPGCGFIGQTVAEMRQHGRDTMTPTGDATGVTSRGHSYIVDNPSREDAIRSAVQSEVDDAIESAVSELCEELWRLHERQGASIEEISAALRFGVSDIDWATAWSEYVEEG